MESAPLLIVARQPDPPGDFDTLIEALTRAGLQPYQARQRLIGSGLACLAQAPEERLQHLSTLVRQGGFHHWLITPPQDSPSPITLRSLEVANDTIRLIGREGELRLDRESRVVAVLADLSGAVQQRHVTKMMAQNAYRGAAAANGLAGDDLYRFILAQRPILDLHILAPDGSRSGMVRVFAGRFDPLGLGERKSLSSGGNLDALLGLLRERVAELRLHTDFGLAPIPGCRLRGSDDGLDVDKANLADLTRFGGIVSALAVATQLTAERGAPAAGAPPEREEVSSPLAANLPPPPDLAAIGHTPDVRRIAVCIAALAVGALFARRGSPVGSWLQQAIAQGWLQGITAVLCAAGAFHFWRLKRQIEELPTSRIRSMAMGLVEIQGRAERCYALASPLRHLPCIHFRLRKYRRDHRNRWSLYAETASGPVPFILRDATGAVRVDPRRATLLGVTSHEESGASRLFGDLEGERWVEEVILDGARLHIVGHARPLRDEHVSLRQRVGEALRQLKLDATRLRRYDTNGDGRIDGSEWDAARADIEQQQARAALATAPDGGYRAEVGAPPQRSLPFVIAAATSEAEVTGRLFWYSVALTTGALLALAWGGTIWIHP